MPDGLEPEGEFGHCDTCGANCDEAGCTTDRAHEVAIPFQPTTAQEQYEQALVQIAAAENALDNAIRRLVAQKIKKVYPTAATLVTFGSYTEDGLMHANAQAVLDAAGTTLAEFVDGISDGEEWDRLTDDLDPLLYDISERDPDTYSLTTEIDLTEWEE